MSILLLWPVRRVVDVGGGGVGNGLAGSACVTTVLKSVGSVCVLIGRRAYGPKCKTEGRRRRRRFDVTPSGPATGSTPSSISDRFARIASVRLFARAPARPSRGVFSLALALFFRPVFSRAHYHTDRPTSEVDYNNYKTVNLLFVKIV